MLAYIPYMDPMGIGNLPGWWFGTTEFYDFPLILGISENPNCYSLHDFSEGRYTTNQK